MMANKYIKTVLIALWFGLLAIPFAGLTKAAMISGAVLAGVVVVNILKSLRNNSTGIRSAGKVDEFINSAMRGRNRYAVMAVTLALLVAFPFVTNRYALDLATQAGIYIVLALGLNIVVGQTGLLVFGYVAFYAVGAYTYAILSTAHGMNFWAVLPIAAFFAGIFGIMLGAPALRLRGDYLAIVTLGFGEITRIVLNNWDSLTGGPNGISGVMRPSIGPLVFSSLNHFYYLVLILVVITIIVVSRLNDSRVGRAWIAIREDEVAAEAMGVNTFAFKMLSFGLGAVVAGLAGVFYVAKMGFVSPESFNFFESVIILCMVVLGGMGSIPGVVFGSIALYLMPEVLRDFQQYRMLIFGGSLVMIMVFRPQGFIGTKRTGIELAHKEAGNL
jgi:branched-chain amino acid transport system permease protein